jgi:hypothetical protein
MGEWISYTRNLPEEEIDVKKINWNSRAPFVRIPCTLARSKHYDSES